MVRTVVLMSIGVCVVAGLLLGVRRRLVPGSLRRRQHVDAGAAPIPFGPVSPPLAAAPGASVAAEAPGAVSPAVAARRRRAKNDGFNHFARSGPNLRADGQAFTRR